MTREAFIEEIRRWVAKHYATQTAAAQALGLSPQYLSDILQHKRTPGPKFLRAVGYEVTLDYHRKRGT